MLPLELSCVLVLVGNEQFFTPEPTPTGQRSKIVKISELKLEILGRFLSMCIVA
jgi:hypothetical protein